MTYKILPDSFDKALFNTVPTHPLQSWEWGEARHATGQKVIRIGGYEGDTLKKVFTITIHDIPHTTYSIGYCARSVSPDDELLKYLEAYGREHNLIFIKFEPNQYNPANYELRTTNYVTSPTPLFPNWTQILDLTESEDALMKNLKSKTRYNIRYAEKNGVTIFENSSPEGFETFAELYFETVSRQTYHGHDRSYHRNVWNNLKNNIAHILLAEHEGTVLAAYELFLFNNILYYPYGGSSAQKRNLMASNLLMWEAIRFGKRMGATRFDMWGSLQPDYDKSKEWAGFTRFKEGYGTEFVQFVGSYDLVIKPLLYPIYNVAYKLRDMLLRARVM